LEPTLDERFDESDNSVSSLSSGSSFEDVSQNNNQPFSYTKIGLKQAAKLIDLPQIIPEC
jgi:hypothetical protein